MYSIKNLLSVLILVGFGLQAKAAEKNKKPNVLMIVVDDCNDMIGAFGDQQIKTPNLDKLSERGVRFTNNHAAATYCTPSRTALMTGVAPWNSGCYGDQPHLYNMPERMSIPELFKRNGYMVFGGGKVFHHMPGYVDLKGFDEYFHWNPEEKMKGWGLNAWKNNPATPSKIPASDFGKNVYENFDIAAIPNELEKDMADTKVCDWAIDVINENHNEPFFLAVGLYAPHKPNFAPQKYFDMYPLQEVKIPEILEQDEEDLPVVAQEIVRRRAKHTHDKLISLEDGWIRAVQGYMASISYADEQIGRILESLEKSLNNDNTIIIFWSDNGYHLGEKKIWAKHTLWERTTNVPMIWAGPDISVGDEYSGVTSLLDIYPTLAELCSLRDVQPFDGKSIVGELKKTSNVIDRTVITVDKEGRDFSVFNNEWHYINYNSGEGEELYEMTSDKKEWTNLALKPEFSKVKSQLSGAIPKNPALPATGKSGLKLVFEGESFRWVIKK